MTNLSKKVLFPVYTWLLTTIASLYRLTLVTRKTRKKDSNLRIVLLISRPFDVELLISLYEKAKQQKDLDVSFWMLKKCDKRFPHVIPLLTEKDIAIDQFVSFAGPLKLLKSLQRTEMFLSTVESTAAPHKLPYIITKVANAMGVSTYTLQHGFENIGLNYCDDIHRPEVKFAAKTIFTWGQPAEFPAWVNKKTLEKSIAVGCPKKLVILKNNPPINTGERPIIAVFDNLFWHRYDEKYRSTFLRHLQDISKQRKEFRFILKSHPNDVRKRSKELAAILVNLENVEVVDLLGEEENLTTPWLLTRAVGVITTPSTIALDAALAKVPVAVSRYGLDLTYYSPLHLLDDFEDWQRYLDRLTEKSENSILKQNGERFLARVLVKGDPVSKMLSVMTRHHREAGKGQYIYSQKL